MKNCIAQLEASNRSCAVVAKSGKARISITEAAGITTDYNGGAKSARINMPTSVTSGLGKLGEGISDTKIVIGSLMESSRSIVASAKNGKTSISFTGINQRRTA